MNISAESLAMYDQALAASQDLLDRLVECFAEGRADVLATGNPEAAAVGAMTLILANDMSRDQMVSLLAAAIRQLADGR